MFPIPFVAKPDMCDSFPLEGGQDERQFKLQLELAYKIAAEESAEHERAQAHQLAMKKIKTDFAASLRVSYLEPGATVTEYPPTSIPF